MRGGEAGGRGWEKGGEQVSSGVRPTHAADCLQALAHSTQAKPLHCMREVLEGRGERKGVGALPSLRSPFPVLILLIPSLTNPNSGRAEAGRRVQIPR